MPIFGVGTDIVEVERMARAIKSRWADRLLWRIFTSGEIAACMGPYTAQRYAARFAAKEAVVKALGIGFTIGISAGMVEIVGGERTRPRIRLHDKALEFVQSANITEVHVSMTHTPLYAGAFAIAECR